MQRRAHQRDKKNAQNNAGESAAVGFEGKEAEHGLILVALALTLKQKKRHPPPEDGKWRFP